MMANDAADRFEACSDAWQEHIDKRDFYAAIAVAVETYSYYRNAQDERMATGCLNLVAAATNQLLRGPESGATADMSCSFCGKNKNENEIKIFAGPSAFICDECVALFYGTLSREQ
jgi:hypothetical protein